MKVTLYTLPIAGAGFLSIPATQPDRRVEIIEDDSVANQGLIYKLPYDNFTQSFDVAPAKEPIVLGSLPNSNGRGTMFALPIQKDVSGTVTLRPADTLVQITSATAVATKIRVTEFS
jgi:hypothetical protein